MNEARNHARVMAAHLAEHAEAITANHEPPEHVQRFLQNVIHASRKFIKEDRAAEQNEKS